MEIKKTRDRASQALLGTGPAPDLWPNDSAIELKKKQLYFAL